MTFEQPYTSVILKGTCKRIKYEEKIYYADIVTFYWKKNSWANRHFWLLWEDMHLLDIGGKLHIKNDRIE